MKLELQENMYIRTKDGFIDKVIIDYNGKCINPNCNRKHISCVQNYYDENDVLKASFNIIDILEVGDYVNGKIVSYDDELECLGQTFINGDGEPYFELLTKGGKDKIKSIVTKEMMESVTYYVK